MTNLNIAYLKRNTGEASSSSKDVNITPIDETIIVKKETTASEINFNIKANSKIENIDNEDKTIDVVKSNGKTVISAKVSLLNKSFQCDDAATALLGEDYRMPTITEFNELIQNCTVQKLVHISGLFLLKYTSNINGEKLYFPLVTDGVGESHVEQEYPYFIDDLDGFDENGLRLCTEEEWENWIDGGYIKAYYWASTVNYYKNTHSYDCTSADYLTVGEDYYDQESGRWLNYKVLSSGYYSSDNFHRGFLIRAVSLQQSDDTVDMGFQSGLKWRKYNLGSYDILDRGSHFAWGETESRDWSEGAIYAKHYYKYYDEENDRNSKYNYQKRKVQYDSLDNESGEKNIKGQLVVDENIKIKKFVDVDGVVYDAKVEELEFETDGTVSIDDKTEVKTEWDYEKGENVEKEVRTIKLGVQSIGTKDIYVRNIQEFIEACDTIAFSYGQAYNVNILDTIDFTNTSQQGNASYHNMHLSGESSDKDWTLFDPSSMTWEFRVLFRYSKIIGYGSIKFFKTLYKNTSKTANDTCSLSFDCITVENIIFGGETTSLYNSSVAFSRPLLKSWGNGNWRFYKCQFICLGEATETNKFMEIGDGDNRYIHSLYHCSLVFNDCCWRCAAPQNNWENTTAPVSLTCSAGYGYMHTLSIFNATKQLTSHTDSQGNPIETGIIEIAISGHKWDVQSDGSAKIIRNANNTSTRQFSSVIIPSLPTTAKTVEGAIKELYDMITNQ